MQQQGGRRFRRLVLTILSSTGLWASGFFIAHAISPGDIIINRVQITGGAGKTDNDLVTIYNKSSAAVDLNGLRLVKRTKTGTADTTIKSWTSPFLLNPGAAYTWANSNDSFATSINADASSAQTISSDNAVAIRQGAENTGSIIDSVGWGTAQNSLIEKLPFPQNPAANELLERISYQDTDNNSLDFHIYVPHPQAACGNAIIEGSESCDDANADSGDGCSELCQLEMVPAPNIAVSVFINEFVADPVSGEYEWIELYSSAALPVDLTNWTIEDGAGTKTKLTGTIGSSAAFKVIDKPAGSLNNAGDMIIIRDGSGSIIDQVVYGDWDDGSIADNASAGEDPLSVARNSDGIDTNSDGMDFSLTSTPTKGLSNAISMPLGIEEADEYDYSRDIIISEIAPNPLGIDDEHGDGEFIELYNRSDRYVRLGGWRLEIGDKQYAYEFPPETVIENKKYLIIRGTGRFQLDSAGATVKLFQPLRQTSYQTVTYKEASEGQSWMLWHEQDPLINKIWKSTYHPTPQSLNIQSAKPVASFSSTEPKLGQPMLFDSSDTDTGGEIVDFSWDFGDGTTNILPYPEHSFNKAGTFTVVLTASNRYGSSTVSKKITFSELGLTDSKQSIATTEKIEYSGLKTLRLSALFPNPTGADAGKEWIKITNYGDEEVSLKGWRIANKNKKGPLIEEEIIVQPEATIQVSSSLPTLGNSNETIKLINPHDAEVDHVSYASAPEGQAYSLVNGAWSWPPKASKEKITTSTKKTAAKTKPVLEGLVASLPNTFSSQYFFFLPNDSDIVYQVYSSKKLFPGLTLGESITVTGELSAVEAGPRIKIAATTDIQSRGPGELPILPTSSSNDLKQPPYPRLARVEGEVTSKKSPRLIITDSQGDTDIYFSKGSSLSITSYALGDKLAVSGILEKSGETIRLMPRSESDMSFLNAPAGPTETATVASLESSFANHTRNSKRNYLPYIILSIAALSGGLGYLVWKYRKKIFG